MGTNKTGKASEEDRVRAELFRMGANASYEDMLDYLVGRMELMRIKLEQMENIEKNDVLRIDNMMKRIVRAEVSLRADVASKLEKGGASFVTEQEIGSIYALDGMIEALNWAVGLLGYRHSDGYSDGIPKTLIAVEQSFHQKETYPDEYIPF